MSTLYFNGRKYDNIPGSWNSLKPWQLLRIAAILHSNMTVNEAIFRTLMCLIDVKNRPMLTFQLLFRTNWEDKSDLLADWILFTDFIFNGPVNLTRQLLPRIRILHVIRKSQFLYGPPEKCKKLVFMEFIKAETYYLQYRKNFANVPARNSALDKLVAVLYRAKQKNIDHATWNGDVREKYNDDTVAIRAKTQISKIPDQVKYAILLFYEGCRQERIRNFPNIFKGGHSSSGSSSSWIDAVRTMAGGALKMEEMGMVNADVALYDLDKMIAESRKKGRK